MYLRFVVPELHEESESEAGVFHAIGELRDAGKLLSYEAEQYDAVIRWFDKNLLEPKRFTAAKYPFYRKKQRAISWFKDSAGEHVARMRDLVAILQNHDVPVRMLTTDRVGYIVYEDEHQVVAEPYADTPH